MTAPLTERARAKVNLTLRIIGRRPDGYHELESLVAFADVHDTLALAPGKDLRLEVIGPLAQASGEISENLVMTAANALHRRVPDLVTGYFALEKRLPVAAGLGGGSADAAAALRLLAQANGLSPDDPRIVDAARSVGADVPVCLASAGAIMRGIGERIEPVTLPRLPAVLVNPGGALATKDVFAALRPAADTAPLSAVPEEQSALLDFLATQSNDLEAAVLSLRPDIGTVLDALRATPGCRIARLSGSGATCFGLFESDAAAIAGAQPLLARGWWTHAGHLGENLGA